MSQNSDRASERMQFEFIFIPRSSVSKQIVYRHSIDAHLHFLKALTRARIAIATPGGVDNVAVPNR